MELSGNEIWSLIYECNLSHVPVNTKMQRQKGSTDKYSQTNSGKFWTFLGNLSTSDVPYKFGTLPLNFVFISKQGQFKSGFQIVGHTMFLLHAVLKFKKRRECLLRSKNRAQCRYWKEVPNGQKNLGWTSLLPKGCRNTKKP